MSVAVVGGGVTGLAAAHRLARLGVETLLLERADRWGGVVRTEEVEGFLLEAGPDSFLVRKPAAAELCAELGLAGEMIPTDPARRGSFMLRRGRLHPLPEGLTSLVPTRFAPLVRTRLLSPAAKLRVLTEPFVARGAGLADESLAGFFRRRLGREASRSLIEPLVRGIYGGDPERLSLRATFPQLADLERRHGSLLVGLLRESRAVRRRGSTSPAVQAPPSGAAFLSLRRGLGSLVDALVAALPRDSGRLRAGVARMDLAEGGLRLRLEDGASVSAEAAVLALPAPAAARLLEPVRLNVAELLRAIPYGSSVTAMLAFDRGRVRDPLQGYGFVVPETEGGPLLACTWASSKFPGRAPAGAVLLRAFLADPSALASRDDAEVAALALRALRPLLGIEGEPRLARVHRWADALPRYELGHVERVLEAERQLAASPGLFLAGAAYHGIGLPD
ncbi:MAG: protoporphyrinogen oxidase, partial [Gemmatimonadota bacterium]